ncbi:Catalase [Blattella germanica]|nr:Catalase [Blattella germanica]
MNSSGAAMYKRVSLTVGVHGPVLLQDTFLLDELAHFVRERIPERVVHAKGSGAFGYFQVTHDVTKVSMANGNWDLVGLDLPVFFVRDGIHFSSLVHSLKRNPVTNLPVNQGIPDCYRHMNGYSIHAFKLVNKYGKVHYARFYMEPNSGAKSMTDEDAAFQRGADPDYCQRDLYNSIASGNFPSWNFSIQLMTGSQAKTYPWNPFDITKDFPLLPIGIMVLNSNPENYFAQVEQIAFSPGNLIPGIEPSPDRVLHARMFAYPDAQRYRLGTNYQQIPINCPLRATNYQRAGSLLFNHQGGAPNYYPNSFHGPEIISKAKEYPYHEQDMYDLEDDDNYSECKHLWLRMKHVERKRLGGNKVLIHFVAEIILMDVKLIWNYPKDIYTNRAIALVNKVSAEFGYQVHQRLLELQEAKL